jgi:hypothetical protein
MDPQTIELAKDIGRTLKPYLPFVVGAALLLVLIRCIGEPFIEIIRTVAKEFIELLKGNYTARAVNALVMILTFLLIVILLAPEPLRHLLLPEIEENASSAALLLKGFYAAVIFFFASFAIICVRVTKE